MTTVKEFVRNSEYGPKLVSVQNHINFAHRQPKLRLRAVHKLDCFFHVMHNNDIGNI